MFKLYKEYLAFIEAQRDDVKFAVHTSPNGEPTIMSKKQFGDWVCGYTGYLRAYPYGERESMTMEEFRKNFHLTIAKDDDGDDVILPFLTIP